MVIDPQFEGGNRTVAILHLLYVKVAGLDGTGILNSHLIEKQLG